MFDIGFFELLVVFVIGLLVLGPERLPKVVRAVGQWTGRAKATLNNLKHEMEREAYNEEMKERFKKQLEELGIDENTLASGQHEEQQALNAAADSSQKEKDDR
ncbi:MAG: Sec-independent protein translocase protein TatB [Alcanivoracaceae bacterium]|nr:Sec-independent protein translocase protein TatB [Alcanivoracaceae bacterium]